MDEKELREVFDGIHMSPALLRKVENMDKNKNKKAKLVKTAAAAFAAVALCIAASNGISYAATGHTWFSKITYYIDGKEVDADVEWTKNGDAIVGTVDMPEDAASFEIVAEGVPEDGSEIIVRDSQTEDGKNVSEKEAEWSEETEDAVEAAAQCEVKEEGDKVYLLVEGGKQKIDITEDIADKEATGEFTWQDMTYQYYVSGSASEYELAVSVGK